MKICVEIFGDIARANAESVWEGLVNIVEPKCDKWTIKGNDYLPTIIMTKEAAKK